MGNSDDHTDEETAEFELSALDKLASHPGRKFGNASVPQEQAHQWQRLFRLGYITGRMSGQPGDDGKQRLFIGAITQDGIRRLEELKARHSQQKPTRRLRRGLFNGLRWLGIYLAGCATPAVTDWLRDLLRTWLP